MNIIQEGIIKNKICPFWSLDEWLLSIKRAPSIIVTTNVNFVSVKNVVRYDVDFKTVIMVMGRTKN